MYENELEEVLEMIYVFWFLGVFERLSGLKSKVRKQAKQEYRISASFSLKNISCQQVTFLSLKRRNDSFFFSFHRAAKCCSSHCYDIARMLALYKSY